MTLACGYGKGARRTALTTEKIAVFAPDPERESQHGERCDFS
jgi:hypothetical protein